MPGTGWAAAALGLSWVGGSAVVTWPPGPTDGARWEAPRPALVAAGEVLAARSPGAGPARLEIADVICCPDAQPGRLLDRYAGATVAAAPGRGRYFRVAVRAGSRLNVAVAGLPVTPACAALLGACFVYGWLATGAAAELLDAAVLTVAACEPAPRWPEAGTRDAPLTFRLSAW